MGLLVCLISFGFGFGLSGTGTKKVPKAKKNDGWSCGIACNDWVLRRKKCLAIALHILMTREERGKKVKKVEKVEKARKGRKGRKESEA